MSSQIHLIDLLNGRYLNHPPSCHCGSCEKARMFQVLDDLSRHAKKCRHDYRDCPDICSKCDQMRPMRRGGSL